MMHKNDTVRKVSMIPLRRCGSHAIRLRLNLAPSFYSPYPLHLVDFIHLLPLYGNLEIDENYFQLVVDLIGLQALSPVKWEKISLDPVKLFERLKSMPRSIHVVAWEILLEAARQQGATVAMDKSLDNVHYFQDILDVYPDMLFLNVVRDPRAQVNSMNKAIIHEFHSIINTEILIKAHAAARALIKACPERVLTIRFEDFISNEAETLEKICNFLGLPFSSAMLDISKSHEAQKLSKQSTLWMSNSSTPIPKNTNKFMSELSSQEIEQIETMAGDIMDDYNYARMTPGKADINPEILTMAHAQSKKLKEKAWEDLKCDNYQDYILRKKRAHYIELCHRNLSMTPRLISQNQSANLILKASNSSDSKIPLPMQAVLESSNLPAAATNISSLMEQQIQRQKEASARKIQKAYSHYRQHLFHQKPNTGSVETGNPVFSVTSSSIK